MFTRRRTDEHLKKSVLLELGSVCLPAVVFYAVLFFYVAVTLAPIPFCLFKSPTIAYNTFLRSHEEDA